jgi:hypothetical protein
VKMTNVFLVWALAALLVSLSSVLWYNTYHGEPVLFRDVPEALASSIRHIGISFGFPAYILHTYYRANISHFFSFRRIATEISLFGFAIDFLFYLTALAIPV